MQNPYPTYAKMRAAGDLILWQDYDRICATSHTAVRAVLAHRGMGRVPPPNAQGQRPAHLRNWQQIEDHSMLELEPPQHSHLRGQVLRAFTSRRIKELSGEIEALALDLIAGFPSGPFDILTQYAQILPVRIIARLLGVPEGDADQLLRWSHAMVAMYQTGLSRAVEDNAETATTEFVAYITAIMSTRRDAPRDDLLSHLLAVQKTDPSLSDADIISTAILLLNAGHEATVHTLGNGLCALDAADHPPITADVVEEVLRYDPPLHMFTRWVYEDTQICGVDLAAGTEIACLLGSANHDPKVFDTPDSFDPMRPAKRNPHLAFGAGIHFCVGAPLARLELTIGLKALRDHCPNLRIAQQPTYTNTYHFHGLDQLIVTV